MGVWNTEIKGNDTTLDIYSNFFDKYNNGGNQVWVSNEIKAEFEDYFSDSDDRNNSLFGLALAQWETKSLEPEIYKTVKEIIENGTDLDLWKELGADKKTLNDRKSELENFLKLISTEKPKAKRRVRPKFEFTTNELVKIRTIDGTKEFRINEEFTNGKYIHTSGIMEWSSGGGAGIMYYTGESKSISAKWTDNNNLEIIHEPNLTFDKKEKESFFQGDRVIIKYKTE
ncbi:hypothetical protein FEZ18_05210 [Oceanihabitans sp. IOP_32]|uniref:hypothetical protein n=1 Tax=Oceanihabitans sp. IOP_32 TaxID=2529032 RepID=UPI001292D1EF|nr:hypothetical protein [Oceanihabitans sp. IOP_32]QFZ54233.1 hypothetical protein FEZ18_05210 [Oceanihabitans sp. IOP_32]